MRSRAIQQASHHANKLPSYNIFWSTVSFLDNLHTAPSFKEKFKTKTFLGKINTTSKYTIVSKIRRIKAVYTRILLTYTSVVAFSEI